MPIAMIFVYQCQLCQAIESVDLCIDSQFESFENRWATGMVYSFCPKCKNTPVAVAVIEAEKRSSEKPKGVTEYAH